MRIDIRTACSGDLEPIVAIEKYSFAEPWSKKDFATCLRRLNIRSKVVIVDEQLIGYVLYINHVTHVEIVNFAIHWEFRRQGIGTQVIDYLIAKLGTCNLLQFILSEYNLPAQLFLKSCEFRCIAVHESHYPDSDEAAYEFLYDTEALWLPANRISEEIE
ncbi:MAG: GNAT family N-acetyltransferase [Chloroflexi bacterium]|nr:GNAT family N-acetyltransferase [Chloroflexota bacterium]